MRAERMAGLLQGIGLCFVIAVLADITADGRTVFGGLAALAGLVLLVRLASEAPNSTSRWWLIWAVVATPVVIAAHVAPWISQVDPYVARPFGQLVATAGAAAYARGMWAWFASMAWEPVARAYQRATKLLGVVALFAAAVGVACWARDGLQTFESYFWVSFLPVLLAWWRLHEANMSAQWALLRADRKVPGCVVTPVNAGT